MRHELLRETQAQPICAGNDGSFCLVSNGHQPTPYPLSTELPHGAQARMIEAAAFSKSLGHPVNSVLTVNAAHLRRIGEGGVFGQGHLWCGLQKLIELIRKWVLERGIFWASIWVREWTRQGQQPGEHWHIAVHLPECLHADFARQVGEWTGEEVGAISPEPGVAARSAGRAWCLSVRAGRGGPKSIGAYFGKAEPSNVQRYGRRVPNLKKPRRDLNGGAGPVEGKRFHISKTLGVTAQARARAVHA